MDIYLSSDMQMGWGGGDVSSARVFHSKGVFDCISVREKKRRNFYLYDLKGKKSLCLLHPLAEGVFVVGSDGGVFNEKWGEKGCHLNEVQLHFL